MRGYLFPLFPFNFSLPCRAFATKTIINRARNAFVAPGEFGACPVRRESQGCARAAGAETASWFQTRASARSTGSMLPYRQQRQAAAHHCPHPGPLPEGEGEKIRPLHWAGAQKNIRRNTAIAYCALQNLVLSFRPQGEIFFSQSFLCVFASLRQRIVLIARVGRNSAAYCAGCYRTLILWCLSF